MTIGEGTSEIQRLVISRKYWRNSIKTHMPDIRLTDNACGSF